MSFISNYVIHFKSCHVIYVKSCHVIYVKSCHSSQIMSFMSNHVIYVKSCHSCQIGREGGGGQGGGVKYVFLSLRRQLCCQAEGKKRFKVVPRQTVIPCKKAKVHLAFSLHCRPLFLQKYCLNLSLHCINT
jgi:hypothetical protein